MDPCHLPEIIIEKKGSWGLITLNRPEVINALSLSMMEALESILKDWAIDATIKAVIIKGNGPRGFCAGGDLRGVYKAQIQKNTALLEHLFRTEYTSTVRLHEFPKPYIAFMHGYCMGGGLGASVHGSHSVISPGAKIAMPEVAIGYFPDVGASWFLNKCPGKVGYYLGLTGNHIQAEDALYAGIGTHYIAQEQHATLIENLIKIPGPETMLIENILTTFQHNPPQSFLEQHQREIDDYFSGNNLKEIMNRLQNSSTHFASDTLNTLKSRSPTSLYITFELLKRAENLSFRQRMDIEFCLSQNFIRNHDFQEGIRAAVIDKDRKPKWQPCNFDKIDEKIIASYFPKDLKEILKF